jgi:methionyl aminopeptidase
MVHLKSAEQVELMRHSSLLVSATLAEIAKIIKPGITTMDLNNFADSFIADHGATPSFKNFHGYPYATCISVNDAVVHGFPNKDVLKDGDVVSVDIGVYKNSYHGDSAYTFLIGEGSEEVKTLIAVTKKSLYLGIEKCKPNNRVGDIGFAIQDFCERHYKFGVVRELVGHGLGKNLHEEPQVPNYGKRGSGGKLKAGCTIAIEPMINMGKKEVYTMDDNWTIKTKDGTPSAHFEHNIHITPKGPDVLSDFEIIEQAEKANANLCSEYPTV